MVAITDPINNSLVDVHDRISGTVSNQEAHVWAVIRPVQTQDCWVQMPILVNSSGSWTVAVQFGEFESNHSGKPYEVRVFANPHQILMPGRTTTCWPEADAFSNALYVTRR